MEFSYILIPIAIFFIVFILAELIKKEPSSEYQKIQYLLNHSELSFYKFLREEIPADISIMCKVRLIDIIKPISKGKTYISDKNKIISKHIDFVLINSETSEIKALVEINGSSHLQSSRIKRDEFIENIARKIDLKLFTVEAKNQYDIKDIQIILEFLSSN